MSCSGCRVLRKGCSENCSIRPCLQWIENPESQAHATLFLAKFYGRAGLMNLINAGPEHRRPDIFRSLLYEACGWIVNPIHGSVGLLWSGSWQLCQQAVEEVLKGQPILQMPSETAASTLFSPLKAYGIDHVAKDTDAAAGGASRAAAELHNLAVFHAEAWIPGQAEEASDSASSDSSAGDEDSRGNVSMFSAETAGSASLVSQAEMELELIEMFEGY